MEYALLAMTIILAFIITMILLDRKNRKSTLRIKPCYPYLRLPGPEKRIRLGVEVTSLLDLWNLSESDQKILLGLRPDDHTLLEMFRSGVGFGAEMDLLGRIGHLLAIDEALGLIYKGSPDRRFRWVTEENQNFDNHCPLHYLKQGYEGILAVRRFIDFERGF